MKREVMVTAGAAAILAAGLAGCSGNKSVSTPNGGVAAAGASNTKVLIDGKDQNVKGQVVCATTAGSVNIAIGGPSAGGAGGGTGIGAVLTDANGAYIFQVSGGKAHRVTVTSGAESQGMVAISGGIDPHVPVVVLGNYELQEGMQVRQGP